MTGLAHRDSSRGWADNTQYDFTIHEINELLAHEKIDVSDEQDFSSGLFCYLASRKIALNHYAQPRERRFFQYHRAGLALRALSIALIAVGAGFALNGAVANWLYHQTVEETRFIEQKYRSKYNQLSQNRVDSNTSTSSMQYIVQTVDQIENRYLRDPEEMLAMISEDISIFPDIRIRRLDWFVSNSSDTQDAGDVSWGRSGQARNRGSSSDRSKPAGKSGYFEIARLEGEFLNFDGNFRYALSAVDDLEKAMAESGKYYSVEITKRPLDIESDNRLSGDASVFGGAQRSLRAELALRVVREVPQVE